MVVFLGLACHMTVAGMCDEQIGNKKIHEK